MKINKFLLVSCIFLLGCNFRPHYSPPPLNLPNQWKAEEGQKERVKTNCEMDCACTLDFWWELFGDDGLNQLETQAVLNNPSLSSAYGGHRFSR